MFEETMHVLSVGIKVLLEQAFTAVGYRFVEVGLYCCLKRRYRFYLLAYQFCWSRPLLLFLEKIQILSASLKVLLKQAFCAI